MRIFWKGQKRNPHSSGDYADTGRVDGSSRNFAGIGFFGFHFRVAWKIAVRDRISDRTDPGCCGKNVFFLCSNGAFTGYLQNTWYRFDAGTCGIDYAQQHRNHFLYHVGLFYVGKSKKTRYTLPGALFATTAGIVASVFLVWKPEVVRMVLLFAGQPVYSSKIVKNIRILIEIC